LPEQAERLVLPLLPVCLLRRVYIHFSFTARNCPGTGGYHPACCILSLFYPICFSPYLATSAADFLIPPFPGASYALILSIYHPINGVMAIQVIDGCGV